MLTTIVFFFALLLSILIIPFDRGIDDSKIQHKIADIYRLLYILTIVSLWSWLYWLNH